MRNNKQRGFTLVELLVVIAILAILATVSVVGYTSYIKNAEISNDQNLASQLNNFRVALNADHTSDFHNTEVTPDNVWAITNEIRELGGLDEITPSALKYGHLYFKFNTDENGNYVGGEYVFVEDKDVINKSGMHYLMKAFAEETPLKPGFFKDDDKNLYFLIDTAGSDIADVVRGFYTLDKYDSLETFLTEASAMTGDYSNVSYWADNTVFITSEGTYVNSLDTDHSNLVVYDDATSISNTKQDLNGNSESITDEDPLVTVTESTTIVLPETIQLSAGSLNIQTSGENVTVEVKIEIENWDAVVGQDEEGNDITVKDNIDANFTNVTVIVVVNGSNYTIDQEKVLDSNGNHVDTLKYNNPMSEFHIQFTDDATDNQVYNSLTDVGYVAYDKLQFALEITGIKGTQSDDSISNCDVIWSIPDAYTDYVELVKDENENVIGFKLTKAPADYATVNDIIQLTATAKVGTDGYVGGENPATQTFDINVVRLTGATITLAGKQWGDYDATLIHDTDKETYTVAIEGVPSYNDNKIDEITLNETISISFGTGTALTTSGTTVTTASAGTGTLSVNVGGYVTYDFDITVFDTSNFTVYPKYDLLKHLGNAIDNLTVGDLFDGTIPEGAELKVFYGLPDADYMNFSSAPVSMTNSSFNVADNSMTLDTTDWKSQNIQFTGVSDSDQPVSFAIFHNGVRISKDISNVNIVNGTNIKDYSELTEKLTSNSLTDSIVLLAEVTMEPTTDTNSDGNINSSDSVAIDYFKIPSGMTLYGNCFTLNVEAGRQADYVIELKGTIDSVKIIGEVYPDLALSAGDTYGASTVRAYAGAVINNCYISNCRAPLRVESGTVILKDSVLFGGRLANVDLHATLNIQGKVTTVQQPILADDGKTTVMGVGIAAWYTDTYKYVEVDGDATFVQYNFMNKTIKDSLPTIDMYGMVTIMDLKEPFNDILTNYASQYGFDGSDGETYVNAGIVATDAYMLDYSVTGNPQGKSWGTVTKYNTGDTVLVKLETAASVVPDTETLKVYYNSAQFEPVGYTGANGYVEISAANLRNTGLTFKAITTINLTSYLIVYVDQVEFEFLVASSNCETLQISGFDDGEYESMIYQYNENKSSTFATGEYLLAKANKGSLTGRGLHYGTITVGVKTPNNATGSEYYTRLEEYIAMGDYYDSTYEFNADGTIANYWETK